jgi:hypothetical protein
MSPDEAVVPEVVFTAPEGVSVGLSPPRDRGFEMTCHDRRGACRRVPRKGQPRRPLAEEEGRNGSISEIPAEAGAS